MKLRTTTLALLGGLAVALPALAQPGPGFGPGPGAGPGGGPGAMREAQERMFDQLDANRDGRVTREEAMAWMQSRFQQADSDRDGAVSLAEFQAQRGWNGAQGPGPRPDAPRAAEREQYRNERRAAMFRGLDANSDGRVTAEEMRPFAEARFRAMDANGDGAVTREELPQRHWHRGPGPQQGGGGAAQPGNPAPAQR